MNKLQRLNLLLLLTVAIFDPSDLLVHAKVPLFSLVWVLLIADFAISSRDRYQVPPNLYLYLFVFVVLLPLISILVYVFRGGGMEGYEGFRYLKSYLFLTLCIPLAVKRINLIRPLTILLSVLSMATIVVYAITLNNDALRTELALIGDAYVIFSLTGRSYGSFSYQSVYFHTSPLLVIAVVYFCYQSLNSTAWVRFGNVSFLLLNVCAMELSGTRNNMIVGLLAPLAVVIWYKGTKARLTAAALLALAAGIGFGSGVFQAMLSTEDYSNATKIGHLHDYGILFSDWRTLLFGQGLGASFFSTAWGTRVTLTELTYLEFIRNYGLILAPVLYGLLLYPISKLADERARPVHYLFLGYLCYLYLCTANPLLLSSSGMLVLAVVLYETFCRPAEASERLAPSNIACSVPGVA